jgi:hypothetical protein
VKPDTENIRGVNLAVVKLIGLPDTPCSPDSSVLSPKFCSSVYCLPGVDNSPCFYLSLLRIIFHGLNIIIKFL